jgi:hypothetical protein
VALRLEEELFVDFMTHLHKPTLDPVNGSEVAPVVDRLQVIQVKSPDFNTANFDPSMLMQEMMDYAKVIPLFMSELFKATGLEGMDNKFAKIRPSFIVFDVSLYLFSLSFPTTQIEEIWKTLNRTVFADHGPTGHGGHNESIEPAKSTPHIVHSIQRSCDLRVSVISWMYD